MLGRYSSAIRAACANERSCGSVRGAISDDRPYRDLNDISNTLLDAGPVLYLAQNGVSTLVAKPCSSSSSTLSFTAVQISRDGSVGLKKNGAFLVFAARFQVEVAILL